ncbi:NrdR family transcriptional regulator [Ectothiorhodospira mobilis]|uniref:NrdR family transcriptional regulator n=1 Tax=Ectothiorhodospira mobilis TaxID=195064 RepID=UPI003F6B6319
MQCPACGSELIRVVDSRRWIAGSSGMVRRRRWCMACGAEWVTWEEWDGRVPRRSARALDRADHQGE